MEPLDQEINKEKAVWERVEKTIDLIAAQDIKIQEQKRGASEWITAEQNEGIPRWPQEQDRPNKYCRKRLEQRQTDNHQIKDWIVVREIPLEW